MVSAIVVVVIVKVIVDVVVNCNLAHVVHTFITGHTSQKAD